MINDINTMFNKFKVNKNDNIKKTKFKKSDDQTNIDKYGVAANIT